MGRVVLARYENASRFCGLNSMTGVSRDWHSDTSTTGLIGEVLTTAGLIPRRCLGCDNVHLSQPNHGETADVAGGAIDEPALTRPPAIEMEYP